MSNLDRRLRRSAGFLDNAFLSNCTFLRSDAFLRSGLLSNAFLSNDFLGNAFLSNDFLGSAFLGNDFLSSDLLDDLLDWSRGGNFLGNNNFLSDFSDH